MEKTIGDDEMKELEEEIDSAVDRLFRDKTGESEGDRPAAPSPVMSSREPERRDSYAPSISLEKLETQLLLLEWEISIETLGRTREEVIALRDDFRTEPSHLAVLKLMEKALDQMMKETDGIRPFMVKFLLDSKETLKLLMREEEGEFKVWKQLALDGLEARFQAFQEPVAPQPAPPSAVEKKVSAPVESDPRTEQLNRMEEVLQHIQEASKRVEVMAERIEQGLSDLKREERHEPVRRQAEARRALSFSIFRTGGKLFGVEHDRVSKVFKVPQSFSAKYGHAERIRLREFDVRMIDMESLFSLSKDGIEEARILLVRDDGGEYKGVIIEEMLKSFSAPLLPGGEAYGECCSGVVQWKEHGSLVEIPVLNIEKL